MPTLAPNETLVETRACRQCGGSFAITDVDVDFLTRLAPTIGGEKIALPLPTMCPECRKYQRLAWRNEKKLYKRKCDATSKEIVCIFPPTSIHTIYDTPYWESDAWDAKKYGRDFDFSKGFFEQFADLIRVVPLPSKNIGPGVENAEYCSACSWAKDCYLTFSAGYSSDAHYSVDLVEAHDSMDCLGLLRSENCYECIEVYDSYHIEHSYDVKNSRDSRFLLSCDGCQDCYGCYDLVNKQYHIYNTPFSESDYKKRLAEILTLPLSVQKKQFEDFYKNQYTKKPLPNTGSENITESVNTVASKNVSYSRHIRESEDMRYCQKIQIAGSQLCMDYTSLGNSARKIYYSYQVGNTAQNIYFSVASFNEISDLYYSAYCRNGAHHCFGCVGLRHGESYCILNKQYTKEEYEVLVPKIIEKMKVTPLRQGFEEQMEWGEFFPALLSPHGYDDSVCQLLHPLTKDEALKQGFGWSGYEAPFPTVSKTIPASKLPDTIEGIPDDILNWAIECEVSGKPFRIIKQELEFYRKHNLPIPRRHPDERYLDRLKWHVNY